jgi:hypothetical protein
MAGFFARLSKRGKRASLFTDVSAKSLASPAFFVFISARNPPLFRVKRCGRAR